MSAAAPREKTSRTAAANARPPVIEVRRLDAYYGSVQVLFDVNLTVHDGEIMVIMGGSGSGKSTLLRHLLGLEVPFAGDLTLLGHDMCRLAQRELAELRRQMGVAFQSGALFSSMTVAENVKLPLREHADLDERTMDIIARLKLEIVDLAGFGHFMPSELSGGMLKRAAVARAIVLDPKVLFFDEPSAGLDPSVAAALDDLILRLRQAMDMTIIVVTHEMESAFKIADRITVLDRGRVLAVESVGELCRNSSPRIQNLLNRRFEQPAIEPGDYLRRLAGDT
jgi:phospholipid/cholesterol/gamma-HCH transport system ATP-binding protein